MLPVPLSLWRLCTVRVIFPVPAPSTGHQPRVRRRKTLAWPSIASLSGANSSTNQESPSLIGKRSADQWEAGICQYWLEAVIVPRPAKASRCYWGNNLKMHQIMIPIAADKMSIIIESQIEFFAPYFMLSWWMLKCCCVKSTIKCSALADIVPIDWSTKSRPALYWIPTKQLEKVSSCSQDMLPLSELI